MALVQKHVQGTRVRYNDLSFGGDMRDITVSFARIREQLGFEPRISVEQVIVEVRDTIQQGVIKDPLDGRCRNANFITQ